ncbi:hypothetical protein ANCCEY_07495 [Ancylostoma ceylanicum]|uniref:Ankyrin repeat protein n=1 Tax=Ancylostoma ceylanicum TaxID=53326 RepID=A0A0D6LNK4_9BILA|nr:hypothetical protein ANCCEY_07495 [Ancylostoma ceylanicum]
MSSLDCRQCWISSATSFAPIARFFTVTCFSQYSCILEISLLIWLPLTALVLFGFPEMTASDLETYPLHKAAFFNDVQSISQLIKAG